MKPEDMQVVEAVSAGKYTAARKMLRQRLGDDKVPETGMDGRLPDAGQVAEALEKGECGRAFSMIVRLERTRNAFMSTAWGEGLMDNGQRYFTMKGILEAGFDPNAIDEYGFQCSGLAYCMLTCFHGGIELLVEHGANPDIGDRHGPAWKFGIPDMEGFLGGEVAKRSRRPGVPGPVPTP